MSVVVLPSVSKVVSRLPLVLKRASAKSAPLVPVTMILPSVCMATAVAVSLLLLAMSVVVLPSVSKVVSRLPLLV